MISMKKRGICLILLLCTVFMTLGGYCKKANAATTFNNTIHADLSSYVTSTGKLHSTLTVDGKKNITSLIEADLYVEKRVLLIFWTRVNIGYPNNTWHDSTTNYLYSNYFEFQLSDTGTYRITVTYTVSGSGGASDVINCTNTVTY